jgi:signal transduction histidine kinase
VLSINDNGKGYDTSKKLTGMGIGNIRTSTKLFKGAVKIISRPGQGFLLRVTFRSGDVEK